MGIFTQSLKSNIALTQEPGSEESNSDVTATEGLDANPTAETELDPLAGAVEPPVAEPTVAPAPEDLAEPAIINPEGTPANLVADETIPEPVIEPVPVVDDSPVPTPDGVPVIPETLVEEQVVATEGLTDTPNQEEAQIEATVPTQEASADLEVTGQTEVTSQLAAFKRPASAKAYQLINQLDQSRRYDRTLQALHTSLDQLQLVANFSQVARERNLSAPLVAAFRAVPSFDTALENFPSQDLFNIVPEHTTTPNNVLGLEALDTATVASVDNLSTKASDLSDAFASTLASLNVTVQNLMDQLRDDREDLDNSDVTDEVMKTLPVHTVSNEAFTTLLIEIERCLRSIDVFSADELRANPDQIKNEIEGIQALTTNLGKVLGLGVSEHGLVEADKGDDYQPSPGSFAEKSLTKSGLVFLLSKADSILDALKTIADRKDDFIAAVNSEVTDMPAPLNSDDVRYGKVEHVTLMSNYTTLVTKLVREAVLVVSMLLSTVDAVLDIDDGQDD